MHSFSSSSALHTENYGVPQEGSLRAAFAGSHSSGPSLRHISAPHAQEFSTVRQGRERKQHLDARQCPTSSRNPASEDTPPSGRDRPQHAEGTVPASCSSGQSHEPKPYTPLSVYESPTATYMWPRFDPEVHAPQDDGPVIYVTYKSHSTGSPENLRSNSMPTLDGQKLNHSDRVRPAQIQGSTPYPRKRSSSIETESSPSSPSDRFFKHARSHAQRSLHDADTSPRGSAFSPADFSRPATRPPDKDLHATFGRLDIESEQSDEEPFQESLSQHTRSPALHHDQRTIAPASHSSHGVSRMAAGDVTAQLAGGEEWMRYAQPPDTSSNSSLYSCSWPIKDKAGQITPCGYSSKRHLVKRHIESKHLQLRPCVCHICGKGFSQKSNLETHLNTHTGDAPHKCPYPNCGEYFKDPARRHRHMKAVHQHVSSRTKKNRKEVDGTSPEVSDPEEGLSRYPID
ncbi:hypothetical protein AcW2_006633 [Taiwanofungus camphoratus]|nr:hypothetical protein AcW2_006633 [Antrodia cinnamomea]